MEKQYWLGILPHVYYVQKNEIALLYNTQNGENIHVQDTQIVSLLEQMHDRKNLGVIAINESTYNQINDFIKDSVLKNIFGIIEIIDDKPKPIQLMPILNLQKDVEKLKQDEGRSLGEGVLHYLSDITIYINRSCHLNCQNCSKYINQFFHCSKSFDAENIYFEIFEQFLEQITFAFIRRLTITGGNIFLYPHFFKLITFLQQKRIKPLFGIHYGNIDIDKMVSLNDFPVEVFVTFPLENSHMKNIADLTRQNNIKIIFEIISEETYNQAKLLIHLYPNGDIKAHPSKTIIGNCTQVSLVKIIEKEMATNTAWRVIRDQTPCDNCLYQYLCPSLSNYELAIGKPNLCSVSF